MQERYVLEADNLLLLEHRSWHWLARRVTGLLGIHSRIRGILETTQESE